MEPLKIIASTEIKIYQQHYYSGFKCKVGGMIINFKSISSCKQVHMFGVVITLHLTLRGLNSVNCYLSDLKR